MGFVDDLRGVAVVFMILWHTLDGWLLRTVRSGPGYEVLRLMGGMAAPLFVLLAGVGAGMKWAADRERGRPEEETRRALVGRGMVIVTLGYGLRLQMWLLDSLAIRHLYTARAWLPMLVGLVLLGVGFHREARAEARPRWMLVVGALAFAVGAQQVRMIAPSRFTGLLRVDVLQCIGASLAIVAAAGAQLGALARPGRALALGVGVVLLTPAMRSWVPGPLPEPVAGYIARWPTEPGRSPVAMFPLFPWLAYAWVGASVGTLWFRRRATLPEVLLGTVVLAAGLGAITSEAMPHVHRWMHDAPWLTQPLRVAYRISLAIVLAGMVKVALDRLPTNPLRTMGQASLLLYWVHLEFAYGISSRYLSRRLGYAEWVGWFAALTVAMGALAYLRRGPVERFLARRRRLVAERARISS